MRRRTKIGLAIAASCFLASTILLWPRLPSEASNALKSADHYELFSIDPIRAERQSDDLFHGHRVLGKTVVADVAVRGRLDAALRDGVESIFSDGYRCFSPRHGIRITSTGQVTDFLICFECHKGEMWRGDQLVTRWITDASPRSTFNEILQQAGVPLPKSDD